MTKKHPQFILAIDTAYVHSFLEEHGVSRKEYLHEGFSTLKLIDFLTGGGGKQDLASHLSLRERHHLETNKSFLQPLNYIVLKQKRLTQIHDISGMTYEDFYSTYYRKKGVGEDRLTDKMSLGWGGHTDSHMVVWDSGALDYIETARLNIITELSEELFLRFVGTEYEYHASDAIKAGLVFKGFILDTSDDVGLHHLALCWEFELPDSIAIESREHEQMIGPMSNIHELVKQKNERPALFENWSNLVIDAIASGRWDDSEADLDVERDLVEVGSGVGTFVEELLCQNKPSGSLDLTVKAPEGEGLIPLKTAGLTEVKSAIDWTPEVPEDTTHHDISVWSAELHNKLKAAGVADDTIDHIVRRTLPGNDLAHLREKTVESIEVTPQGLFFPDIPRDVVSELEQLLAKPQ